MRTNKAASPVEEIAPRAVKPARRSDIVAFPETDSEHAWQPLLQRDSLSPTEAQAFWNERAEVKALLLTAAELPPPATIEEIEARLEFAKKHQQRLDELDRVPRPAPINQPEGGPALLTTPILADCLDGVNGWDAAQWTKCFSNQPKWLAAPTIPGARGRRAAMWNPVLVAGSLAMWKHNTDETTRDRLARTLRARFQKMPPLEPWLEAWKDYEADHLTPI